MSECGFTKKGGKVISKAPALFQRKILLAFAVLSAETPGLCCGDKAPVCASLPVPSPPLGSPPRAMKHSPCVLQPLEGTRALEHTALPSQGQLQPLHGTAAAAQPRLSSACLTEGKRMGREECHDPQLVLQRDTQDCKLMWHPARTAALITSCCAELWCTPATSDSQALGESPLLGKGTGEPGVDMKGETLLPSHQRSSTNVMGFAEKYTCK